MKQITVYTIGDFPQYESTHNTLVDIEETKNSLSDFKMTFDGVLLKTILKNTGVELIFTTKNNTNLKRITIYAKVDSIAQTKK